MNAVDCFNLSYSYPAAKRREPPRTVLHQLNLTVPRGGIFGLLGPNGGGKTTLFRLLSTALRPEPKRVWVLGNDVAEKPSAVRQKIGVVFQSPSLDKSLTVNENLFHHGRLYGLSAADSEQGCRAILKKLSLADRAGDEVQHLSGGLQRRVEIAMGLLHRPELLLMDEPTTGLDPSARREVWDVLFELKKQGVTILMTTHLMEEGDKCDHLAILHRGRCVASGAPDQLKKTIGGDVISIHAADPARLAENMKTHFHLQPSLVNGTIRLEITDGHTFIPSLIEAFPGLVESVALGKPTLEDVFVHETGHSFSEPREA